MREDGTENPVLERQLVGARFPRLRIASALGLLPRFHELGVFDMNRLFAAYAPALGHFVCLTRFEAPLLVRSTLPAGPESAPRQSPATESIAPQAPK